MGFSVSQSWITITTMEFQNVLTISSQPISRHSLFPQPLATTPLCSASMDLPILESR